MTKSNVHLIADETLGGVQREYIEVERKASVGDYVTTRHFTHTVSEVNSRVILAGDLSGYYSRVFEHGEYTTLEPSDIVHIEGTRYRLVERKAEIGENVIDMSDGAILSVYGICKSSIDDFRLGVEISEDGTWLGDHEYRVLIPVKSNAYSFLEGEDYPEYEDCISVDATQCSEAVLGMLANLARRVTELERKAQLAEHFIGNQQRQNELQGKENMAVYERLQEIGNNVETFAQEHATLEQVVKSVKERGITTAEQTESNTQDIADLDGRTQTLVEPKQAAEALLRKIAKLIEEEGVGI